MAKFTLKAIGANEDGSRVFTALRYGGKTVLKGFYDFDKERYSIIKYIHTNIPNGYSKRRIRKILKEILDIEYDWEL